MSVTAPDGVATGAAPEAVLQVAYESFPRVVIVASFQAESSVLIDMASRIRPDVNVLTARHGPAAQETYDMIDRVRDRYAIDVEVCRLTPATWPRMVAVTASTSSTDPRICGGCAAISASHVRWRGPCMDTTRG